MKKQIGIILALLLVLSLPLTIYAVGTEHCKVTVDSVAGKAGETITVAVRIAENPGFTNFFISLEYDASVLKLQNIETGDENGPYLCGQYVSVHDSQVVAACPEPVETDGILFVATFMVAEGSSGSTKITPKVHYIRNNEGSGSAFREIQATVEAGFVTAILPGDLNADGRVEYDDVMLAYKAFLGDVTLTATELSAVDENQNGTVEEAEYLAIYGIYIGG